MPRTRFDSGISAGGDSELGAAMGQFVKQATIARTDTVAKQLFDLPAGAVITNSHLDGPVSNAGTTATVSLGIVGVSTNGLVNAQDVKGAGPHITPASLVAGSVGAAPVRVQGIYAESGTVSTAGGPWVVTVEYVL